MVLRNSQSTRCRDRWLECVNGEMTPAELRDWYSTPEHYRVEHRNTNRSHTYEGLDR